MEVILKENIKNLGKAGEIVKVNEGYARNFLIPHGKAVIATDKGVKELQDKVKRKQELVSGEETKVKELAAKLNGREIILTKKASEDNKLFGSVTEVEIAEELKKIGFESEKHNIIMEKHIKETGTYTVPVKFKFNQEAKVKVTILKEIQKKGH